MVAIKDALKYALLRVAQREGRAAVPRNANYAALPPIPTHYESPLGKNILGNRIVAWHATAVPKYVPAGHPEGQRWLERGRLNMNRGEGFGLHVGTQKSAEQRVASKSGLHYESDPVFIDVVARSGREVRMPDMGHWGSIDKWFHQSDNRMFGYGMTDAEKDALIHLVRGAYRGDIPYRGPWGKTMRKALLSMGIDRVRYRNGVEDSGKDSVVLLDPRKVRWGSLADFNPNREHWPNLLAGIGGAGATTALLTGTQRGRSGA